MIIFSGPFESISGYGKALRDYVLAFKNKLDIRTHFVNYDPTYNADSLVKKEFDLVKDLRIDFKKEKPYPDIFVCDSTPNASYVYDRANKNILMSVWETDRVPEEFGPQINRFDLVLTASEFSRNAFLKSFPNLNIKVLPHIIKKNNIEPTAEILSIKEKFKDKLIFLFNGEWHLGKGYDVLIKSFCEVFAENKNVALILKTYSLSSTNYKDDVIAYIKSIKQTQYPQIFPIIGNIKYEDVLSLYRISDIYLNMSRREGFSLTSAEAIDNCIILAPDKGGHREFLNESNSMLIESRFEDIKQLESERRLYTGQKWIEMNYDDLCDKLKYVYENHNNLRLNCDDVFDKFSEEKITKKFIDFIK